MMPEHFQRRGPNERDAASQHSTASTPGGLPGGDKRPVDARTTIEQQAVRSCQLLAEAVRAACVLIWQEDAAFVQGGPKKLDEWVDKYGPLVGFDTGDRDD